MSIAMLQQPGWGGSLVSLLGIDLYCHVEGPAGLENHFRVEHRLGGAGPRSPWINRPVQCPSTLVRGLEIPPTMRCVIVSESDRSLECTLDTTTSSSAEQVVCLDQGRRPRGCRTSIPRRTSKRRHHLVEGGRSVPFGYGAGPRRSPRATVNRGEWSVRRTVSCPSWRAVSIISSGGLPPSDQFESAMQISFERGSHAVLATIDERLLLVPQLLQILRYLTGHRLADHHCGLGTDPLHFAPGVLLSDALVMFFLTHAGGDHICRAAIGPHAIGVGSRALQQEADLPQGFPPDSSAGRHRLGGRGPPADVRSAWREPPSPSRCGRPRAETAGDGRPGVAEARRSRRGCGRRNSTT